MPPSTKPCFIFRIDEIRESRSARHKVDSHGIWVPSTRRGDNDHVRAGTTGMWWYCDGQNIRRIENDPPGSTPYQVFSVYYCDHFGFKVLRGDAAAPSASEAWQPLWFDHDSKDYSSYLTNVGTEHTLRCQRNDQIWPAVLLPTTNHVPPVPTSQRYGGLKGDLAIFIALLALSMDSTQVAHMLPYMFQQGRWELHSLPHGRLHGRGVVVYIYTCPPNFARNLTTSQQKAELRKYQDGEYGNYYN